MTLTPISTPLTRSNEQVIEYLEDFLKMAKTGQITSVAIAAVDRNRDVWTAVTETIDNTLLISAITVMQHRVVSSRGTADALQES